MRKKSVSRRNIWPLGFFEGQYVLYMGRKARVVGLSSQKATMVAGDCVPIVYEDSDLYYKDGRPACLSVPAEDLQLMVV